MKTLSAIIILFVVFPLNAEQAPLQAPKKKSVINSIIPEYVRPLLEYQPGHNDSNPAWGKNGKMMGFERSKDQKKEIVITGLDGKVVKKIYYKSGSGEELDIFIPGVIEDISYNAGITWSPNGQQFVFMSNGGEGNYDLYLGSLGSNIIKRLTNHPGKDGQPHWSPNSNDIVFVSGRSGKAEIYLLSLNTNKVRQLTNGKHSYLYPVWSPDGNNILMTYGQNENHDVIMITDVRGAAKIKAISRWRYDDLRPTWSPNGKKIAFYTNYNTQNDARQWAIVVVDADREDYNDDLLKSSIVAKEVRPDVELGPAWLSDSSSILYVKAIREAFYPIYAVNILNGKKQLIKTDTKINHDISSSSNGVFAFRAQVDQWDQIYLAKIFAKPSGEVTVTELKKEKKVIKKPKVEEVFEDEISD